MSLQGQSRHFEDPNEARRQTEGASIKHRIQTRFDAVARRPRARHPDDPAIRGRERPHFGAVEALPLPAPRRVASVDAVRGFTMFWIIGADGAAKALAEMLSGKGTILSTAGNIIGGQFEHAEWEGLHFYDLIFPLFIFVTGVAIVFSLTWLVEQESKFTAHWRVLRRSLLLFALGLVYYGGLSESWPDIRLLGVLNRIDAQYLLARAEMERRLGPRRSAQYAARNRHLSARRVRRPAAEGAKPATAPKDLVAEGCRCRDDRARSALGAAVPDRQEHLDVLVRARVRRIERAAAWRVPSSHRGVGAEELGHDLHLDRGKRDHALFHQRHRGLPAARNAAGRRRRGQLCGQPSDARRGELSRPCRGAAASGGAGRLPIPPQDLSARVTKQFAVSMVTARAASDSDEAANGGGLTSL